MVWAKRILLALILFLMACPASAAIDRFTDNQGVIHLTNTKEKKARHEEREQSSPLPPEPAPAAPAEVAKPLQDTEPGEPEDKAGTTKSNSYLTVRKGVIHITNVPDRQVELARDLPATPRVQEAAPGDLRVALEHPAAPVIPAAFDQVASVPTVSSPKLLPAGSAVKTYRDKKGVIHITNAPTKPFKGDTMVAGWSSAGKAKSSGEVHMASKATGTTLLRKSEPQEALPIREASMLEPGALAVLPAIPATLRSPPDKSVKSARTKVRRFKDDKGVIHIVGKGPAPGGRHPVSRNRMMTQASLSPVMAGALIPTLSPTVVLRRDKQGRLVIQNAPRGPTKGDKEEICRQLAPVIVEAALIYGLPVSLIEAVIKIESNFQPCAVSPKGAMGLMQLMPGTANFLGVEDAFCPRENVLGGCRYLRLLLDFFGQSLPLALAAYNAGFQRVIDAGCQVPDIKETQDFITKVMGHYFLREKQYLTQRLIL